MAPRYISLHDLFPKLQTLISNHLFEILTCTLDWYIEPNRFKIKFPHQACSPVSTSINGTASHPVAQARSLGVMSDSFFLSSSIHITQPTDQLPADISWVFYFAPSHSSHFSQPSSLSPGHCKSLLSGFPASTLSSYALFSQQSIQYLK